MQNKNIEHLQKFNFFGSTPTNAGNLAQAKGSLTSKRYSNSKPWRSNNNSSPMSMAGQSMTKRASKTIMRARPQE